MHNQVMPQTKYPLVLASKSPRRSKLLKDLNFDFTVLDSEVNEDTPNELPSLEIASTIALRKWINARNILIEPLSIILTADTVVILDQKPLGKPKDREEAYFFLRSLSNNVHKVVTAFCLGINSNGIPETIKSIVTQVTFRHLNDSEIEDYIKSGSPFDKAGGYGFQDDVGASFVSKIDGSTHNVIGLPTEELIQSLRQLDYLVTNAN